MPRLRLINPRNPLNGLVQNDVARRVTLGRKAIFMPLGLAVAANWGFRYYYRRQKKRMPDFRDAWASRA